MMQLLSAWKESLQLFKPSNFKLFFLVTLKTFVGTLQVWLTYWWWLIGLVIAGPYIMSSLLNWWAPVTGKWVVVYSPWFAGYGQGESFIHIMRWLSGLNYDYDMTNFPLVTYGSYFIVLCLLSLLHTSIYLSARSSVALKNWPYFLGYGKHLVYIVLWFFLLNKIVAGVFFKLVLFVFSPFENALRDNMLAALGVVGVSLVLTYSFALCYIIFLLDSDASIKSVGLSAWRTCKMVLYNFPFFLVLMSIIIMPLYFVIESALMLGALGIASYCIPTLFEGPWLQWVTSIMLNSIDIFFMLLLACFFVNYYIKKIHDNYSFYVGN